MSLRSLRFAPQLEVLDSRVNLSPAVAGRITGVVADPADPGISVLLRRLANPQLPDSPAGGVGSHALYQDLVIPAGSSDSSLGKYLTLRPRPTDTPGPDDMPVETAESDGGVPADGRKFKMLVAPLILEVGTANGGAWKTMDGGTSW